MFQATLSAPPRVPRSVIVTLIPPADGARDADRFGVPVLVVVANTPEFRPKKMIRTNVIHNKIFCCFIFFISFDKPVIVFLGQYSYIFISI
jgi:hypothetical protein